MTTEFFRQLASFSIQVLTGMGCDPVCQWKTPGWPTAAPKGLIVHFTASGFMEALRWFMQARREAKASAHLVIGRSWPRAWRKIAESFPLVESLPAPVVQCVPYWDRAWHATWTNPTHYGIELANHGELRKDAEGQWVFWAPKAEGAPEWTARWQSDGAVPGEEPVSRFGRWWEPYPAAQVVALVRVAREVRQIHSWIQRDQLLGHEQVQENKRDPGPAFPLSLVREAIFAPQLAEGPFDGIRVRADDVEFVRGARLIEDWAVREFPLIHRGELPSAVGALRQLLGTPEDETGWESTHADWLCFDLLGYVVGAGGPSLSTVQTFQRMMGLGVDSQVGKNTRWALARRVLDRGIIR